MTEFADITTEAGREAVRKLRSFAATNPLAHKIRDGLYTAVGLGVVTAQKVNVNAQKISQVVGTDSEKVKASVQQASEVIEVGVKEAVTKLEASLKDAGIQLDDVVKSATATARTLLDTFGDKLPAPVRQAADKVVGTTVAANEETVAASDDTPAQPEPDVQTPEA
jgi:hypothetical protein